MVAVAAALAMAGAACTSRPAVEAAPPNDRPLRNACAAAREARDEIVVLQNSELSPEVAERLTGDLVRLSEEAERSRNEKLRPFAREALAAQRTFNDEAVPLAFRHDAFHTVIRRIGRIFALCEDAGTPMAGVRPTVPSGTEQAPM